MQQHSPLSPTQKEKSLKRILGTLQNLIRAKELDWVLPDDKSLDLGFCNMFFSYCCWHQHHTAPTQKALRPCDPAPDISTHKLHPAASPVTYCLQVSLEYS